jgi:hypothetical protein
MRRSRKWFIIAFILAGNAHADEPPSATRNAALESTVARRKAERERKAAAVARRRVELAQAKAQALADWERMAPILAAHEVEMARVQTELNAQWLEARRLEAERQERMALYYWMATRPTAVILPGSSYSQAHRP